MMSISRSTASLDSFRTESRVDKLSRLSKSYSLTNLSKRKRSSSSERTFDKDTLSYRNKSKIKSSESPRDKTLSRLSKNIERDRNSERIFSKAYQERCIGVMNQTTSRTDSKRRDTAALSGSAGKTRLPPISKPASKQAAPISRARSGKAEVVNSAPPRGKSGRNEDARKKSGRPEENARGGRGRGGKNFAGAVNRANPGRGLAGTVNRAMAANRGGVSKPADDVKLNRKYSGVVCETCKLQIHEKLKRGYAKYRSLEKMKSCEKCQKSVIDFDFYQICIDCAKDLRVCAKCASGSTMISGERFVEVVRQGVEENFLSMNERELSQFAKKHAKIGIVEQKISTIEDQTSDKSAASTRTHSARSSAKSRKASSARSNRSSKVQSPRQVDSELKVEKVPKVNTSQSKEVSKNARSMTSSSSPLIDGESETETCLSGTESDEAYGSGHISSVSDVKTVRSGKLSSRSRHKSSEILRQIRSLTTLQVTSPTSAQSVIREIRSLTEMDCYDDDDDESLPEDRQSPENLKARSEHELKNRTPKNSTEPPCYTPFSSTSDKSNLQEDPELQEYKNSRSRTPTLPPITITGTVTTSADPKPEVREYSPSPPVVTITTITKERSEGSSTDSSTGSSSSDETDVEDQTDANCDEIQQFDSNLEADEEIFVEEVTVVDTCSKSDDSTIENEDDEKSSSIGDEDLENIAESGKALFPDDMVEPVSSEQGISGVEPQNEDEDGQFEIEVAKGGGDHDDQPSYLQTENDKDNPLSETEELTARRDVLSDELPGESSDNSGEVSHKPQRKENDSDNNLRLNNDCVTIEDVSEEELLEKHQEQDMKTTDAISGAVPETADLVISLHKEEKSDVIENGTTVIITHQETKSDDVRIEDVTDDQCIEISVSSEKLVTPESTPDNCSESTDEARLSSELETFLGDTPKSLETEYSPRNQQARSQDPSSTEVLVSSSASDRQPETNIDEVTPRSRKPIFERQISEDNEPESVLDTVGVNFEEFSQFHQNHMFDIEEIHKNSPEEILYEAPEEQDYYQYHYNARLRIRLEDIPEEGTLSKESTYLSHPFTDTFDKEDTVIDREESMLQSERSVLGSGEKDDNVVENDSSQVQEEGASLTLSELDREQSVEIAANDIVNCALIRASLSLIKNDTSAIRVDTTS